MAKSEDDELARPPDAYEKGYMASEGRVLHRDKMVGGWGWQALLMSPAAIAVAATVPMMASGDAPALAMLAVAGISIVATLPLWALFSVLRITVSTENVHVQYGTFGPTIPISAIQSVKLEEYKAYRTGYGIKYLGDSTWLYNMLGDAGTAVRIEWLDEGKKKTTMLSSHDPAGLLLAIRRAMAEGKADGVLYEEEQKRGAKVRVESPESETAEVTVEAVEEAKADS